MFKTITLLVLLFCAYTSGAQVRYAISGSITDKKTGEQLIGATVRVAEQQATGTVTNEYGFYSITLTGGSYTLLVNYMGFAEQSIPVKLDKDVKLDIGMSASGKQLSEVVVSSKVKNDNVTNAQMGMDKLNVKDIKAIPVLFGEKDVLKTIQLLPGIKSAGEGNSGLYVRGGNAGQNLILLDDAPVYQASHLMGFFSTFNSDAIKDVAVYKGGMPAQYGGSLSSVIDVKMNDGNNQDFGVSGGIGLISSKLNVEGPIVKDRSSFLITARRTYADAFLKLSNDSTYNKNKLYFYDLNAKVNYKLGEKDRVFLSAYTGRDKLALGHSFGIDWGNATGTLRWNHIISNKVFSNTSVIFSDYNMNLKINEGSVDAKLHSEIKDWNLKEEVQIFPRPGNSIRVGINTIYHIVTPGEITGSVTAKLQDRHSWQNAVYFSQNLKATDKLNIEYGLRLSSFSVLGGGSYYTLNSGQDVVDTLRYRKGDIIKTYFNPEPRLSASYQLNEYSSVKGSYARNAQYLHLVSNSTSGDPTDKWISSSNIIKPGLADQVSLGYFRNFMDDQYEFSVESYYKYMQNVIDYKEGADVVTKDAIETQLLYGIGRAYGIELMLKKKTGRLTGWVSYTLSRSENNITQLNHGNWYTARQDRTHDLSIVGIYSLSKKWTVSGTWVLYTGNAVTFPDGKYQVDNKVVSYYNNRNGYRMPLYHRMDLGATYQLKPHKRYTSELAFSLYNAYGHENAYSIAFEQSKTNPGITEAVQTSLFTFIPSVSYNFKF